MRRAIAAEEDLKVIAENWELLDARVKSERRARLENVVPKVLSDLKEKPYDDFELHSFRNLFINEFNFYISILGTSRADGSKRKRWTSGFAWIGGTSRT